jgi:hypothetical protein
MQSLALPFEFGVARAQAGILRAASLGLAVKHGNWAAAVLMFAVAIGYDASYIPRLPDGRSND